MNKSPLQLLLLSGVKKYHWNNTVFYLRLGRVAQRQLSPSKSTKEWRRTEKRAKANNNFAGMRILSSHMKDVYEGLPVWEHATKFRTNNTMTADNYRHKVNHAYVNEFGEVIDHKHLVVSDGSLVLPLNMTMVRKDNMITLTWEDHRDTPSAKESDIPHAIVIGSHRNDALMLVHRTTPATRGSGTVTFKVNAREKENLHIYPFFGNDENEAFSPNEYFFAPWAGQAPAEAPVQ